MDLPTYTNIWRIEKRLYKLYDLRLPMPLPLVQIGVFLGVFVPWILLLRLVGIPFESPWHVLYIVPPGVLTWMATRPVIEGKRLTELLLSQGRYLAEPRTWCRLTPIREPREVVIVARVWRRAEAPAAMERAAVKAHRRRRPAAEPTPLPARPPSPATAAAPPSLAQHAAQAPSAPPKPWRRTTRDISHEDDVLPVPAEMERPPATPRLEGSGKRALASGVHRPGAPAEVWQAAAPTRPDVPQQNLRRAAEEIANGPRPPAPHAPGSTPRAQPSAPRHPGAPGPAPAAPATGGAPQGTGGRPDVPAARHPGLPAAGPAPAGAPSDAQAPGSTPSAQPPAAQGTGAPPGDPAIRQPNLRATGPAPAARSSAEAARDDSAQTSPQPPAAQGTGDPSDVRVAGRASAPRPAEGAPAESQQVSASPSAGSGAPQGTGDPSGVRVAGRASASAPSEAGQAGQPTAPAAGPAPAGASADARPAGRDDSQESSGQPPVAAGDSSDVRVAGRASAGASAAWSSGAGRDDSPEASGQPPVAEGTGGPSDVRVAGRGAAWSPARGDARQAGAPSSGAPQGAGEPADGRVPERRGDTAAGGEPGDKKVAGARPAPPPPPWAPPVTRPDVPMVPGAFGQPPAPRREPPRPWSEGLSRPQQPAAEPVPAVPEPAPPTEEQAPPMEEQAPPREVRSQPASPVRPRPLPPPPAPPPSGPAITPPGPEHEVTTGGLRRLIHAVGGGHGEIDAEYQQRLQQPFHGTRHVVVLGCTGGAGQTVTALMLGHTFAQHNGEPVVAIDVNPGPGALARRTRSDTNETLTGLITRADQVNSLTAMRRYTSQAKSGLDVIAAGKNPLQALDDRDYALAIRTIDRFYSVTLLDAAAAVVARVLPYADQIVLVAPASADAPRAVAMTFEWLDGHGYEELRSRAVTVINGVSRRSMDDVEQAEAVARGRCRALVRIPWDDHLSMDRAPRNELKSLRTPTRRAYLALAGVVAGGFTVMPERYQELQQEQEATR
ncbi:TcpE family conjugal transfer membrane protein [Spirillospora sp. NPDC127506]